MLAQEIDPESLQQACGDDPSFICERVLDWTRSEGWAEVSDKLLATPLTILLILAIAYVANRLVRRAIRRLTNKIAAPEAQDRLRNLRKKAPGSLAVSSSLSLRSAARARTLGTVLRGIASAVIWTIAVAMILGELGVNLGPLIAGAGIAGVALGFGAQSLVKDFIAGIFMLIEDQFGVGDIIDAGPATGTVEAITLRTTRLRDAQGTVWHVPNGTIARVGNLSQQWSRALLDIEVAWGSDVDRVQAVIKEVADGMWGEATWRRKMLEAPEVWGVERLDAEQGAIAIRLVVKTRPAEQFPVVRELRRRLANAFADREIAIRPPQAGAWARREPGTSVDVADEESPMPPSDGTRSDTA